MQLRAKNSIYGLKVSNFDPTSAGEVFTVDDEQGQALVDAGAAEIILPDSPATDASPVPAGKRRSR